VYSAQGIRAAGAGGGGQERASAGVGGRGPTAAPGAHLLRAASVPRPLPGVPHRPRQNALPARPAEGPPARTCRVHQWGFLSSCNKEGSWKHGEDYCKGLRGDQCSTDDAFALLPVFHPEISPRNLAIIALRAPGGTHLEETVSQCVPVPPSEGNVLRMLGEATL